jgi:hypothetical protein
LVSSCSDEKKTPYLMEYSQILLGVSDVGEIRYVKVGSGRA